MWYLLHVVPSSHMDPSTQNVLCAEHPVLPAVYPNNNDSKTLLYGTILH
jgi:hypothetical protein